MKSNMGDQPALPRSLENMVRQECRKESARERLRKKHEKRKVKLIIYRIHFKIMDMYDWPNFVR